jgi:hypothetical protein
MTLLRRFLRWLRGPEPPRCPECKAEIWAHYETCSCAPKADAQRDAAPAERCKVCGWGIWYFAAEHVCKPVFTPTRR